jgi:hypothetical protein
MRKSNQAMRKPTDKSVFLNFAFKIPVFWERVREVIHIMFNDSVFECEIL